MATVQEWDFVSRGMRRLSAVEIRAFWEGYAERRDSGSIERGSLYSRWRWVADDLVISLYITNRSVGLFVRGPRGESRATTLQRLVPLDRSLSPRLGSALHGADLLCYLDDRRFPMTDPGCWPDARAWLMAREEHYYRVLIATVRR